MKQIKLKCNNKKCLYEWVYKGNKKIGLVATCPSCLFKVRIKKIEKELIKIETNPTV